MFLQMLGGKKYSMEYLNGSKYLQRIMLISQKRLSYSEEFRVQCTLEVLLVIHGFSTVQALALQNCMRALRNDAGVLGPQLET